MRFFVKNFRTFDVESFVDIGGITILLGPNSGGKSSLLRLMGAVATTFSRAESLSINRALVRKAGAFDLGPASELLSWHEEKRGLEFGFHSEFTLAQVLPQTEVLDALRRSRPRTESAKAAKEHILRTGKVPSWKLRWKLALSEDKSELVFKSLAFEDGEGLEVQTLVPLRDFIQHQVKAGKCTPAQLKSVINDLRLNKFGLTSRIGRNRQRVRERPMIEPRVPPMRKEAHDYLAVFREFVSTVDSGKPTNLRRMLVELLKERNALADRNDQYSGIERFLPFLMSVAEQLQTKEEMTNFLVLFHRVFGEQLAYSLALWTRVDTPHAFAAAASFALNEAISELSYRGQLIREADGTRRFTNSPSIQDFWGAVWRNLREFDKPQVQCCVLSENQGGVVYGQRVRTFSQSEDVPLWAALFRTAYAFRLKSYLPPIRDVPPRVALEAEESSWRRLLSISDEKKERIDSWLTDLGIGHTIDWNGSRFSDKMQHHFYIAPRLERTAARAGARALSVSLHDVGFGVSQILPVVLECGATESSDRRSEKSDVFIEQPELHLHPKVQARLARVMVESHREYSRRFFLETHSEHFVVRLQNEVAAGNISRDSVRVHWVNAQLFDEQGIRMPPVTHMQLDSKGRFEIPWPEGFFDESYRECAVTRSEAGASGESQAAGADGQDDAELQDFVGEE